MRLSELRLSVPGLSVLALAGLVSCLPVAAQQLISAKSGLIHYTEGDVKIGNQAASPNNGTFQSLSNGKELATFEGRAEMLLGPGQFVRLNENSAVRMVSNKLDSTRVDLLKGSILVEMVDADKNAPVTIGFGGNTIELRKAGLYRIDASDARLRVFEGEAVVMANGQTVTAKKSKEISMGAVLAQNGFDASAGDEFTRWAQRRAGYIATANVSGARDLFSSGQNWSANNWAYNPWYGMYTYVPSRRMFMSPFGFYYFSPEMAYNGMFWGYLGGGYGFYGMGFGSGYGYPYYGAGYGYGYGNGSGYGGTSYSGGGGGKGLPNRNGYPTPQRPDAFGPRGTTPSYTTNNNGYGNYGGPSMVRGGGTSSHNGDSGGSSRGGGGYSTVSGGSAHVGGGGGNASYSGGGGHSSGTVSGGGSVGSAPVSTGGGAASGGASAGGRTK